MNVSIGGRIVWVFLLLMVMAALQTVLVRYVQREAERALFDAERTQQLLHDNDEIGRALAGMQSAQRGFLITGSNEELSEYETQYKQLRRFAARIPVLIVDEEQRARFERILTLVDDWRVNAADMLIERRRRGEDVVTMMMVVAVPRYDAVRDELEAFENRQTLLSNRAAANARARLGRATSILILTPVVGVLAMIALIVATTRAAARAAELDRMKDEFVSIVSHELRTPLTAIRGSLQLLLGDPQAVADDGNRQLLETALRSCERLVRIVNDILDISRIEAGQLTLRRAPLAVSDIVQQSVESVQQIARQAGVHVASTVARDLPSVMGDADRLTQALVNLLSNAVKFAPAHSTVTIDARDDGASVVVSVRDQGRGIAPDDAARLFQKFQQLDSSGSRRVGGTGLGLVITKAIVEEHGGRVWVESGVGRGSTFSMALPRA